MIDVEVTVKDAGRKVLAFDTEVANRWWWYDGKSTNRLMMFVGQWLRGDAPWKPPFGWIFLPDVFFKSPSLLREYRPLPVTPRRRGLAYVWQAVNDADVLVGHNVKGFDLGVIDGELMLLNMPLLPKRDVVDTLKDGPSGTGQSRSLGNRLSRLPGSVDKPHVDPAVWEAAFNEFDPEALREVWARARADVQGHVDLYLNDRELGYLTNRRENR